jgi:hypothetical protein
VVPLWISLFRDHVRHLFFAERVNAGHSPPVTAVEPRIRAGLSRVS